MYSLVYVSSATAPMPKDELLELLSKAREHNSSKDITGLLLYKDGNFMQMLEGDEQAVTSLYQRIELDPRHRGAIVLLKDDTDARQFPDWSMGFRDLTSPELKSHPGFSHFMNTPLTAREFEGRPGRARTLLQMFKEKM
jgi:hypothetical protein